MSEHALLSPSGAYRWAACPASLRAEENIYSAPSQASIEGTNGHSYVQCVLNGTDTKPDIPPDLKDLLDGTIADMREYFKGGLVLVEQRVPFGEEIGQPDELAFGTADIIALVDNELQVHDLKCGRVPVDVKDNLQLAAYALGAMRLMYVLGEDVHGVRLVIHQPRVGGASEHRMMLSELNNVAAALSSAAALALSEEGRTTYITGDHCRYCKHAPVCPKLVSEIAEEVSDDFEPLGDGAARGEKLSANMKLAALAADWAKKVFAEARNFALAGNDLPGFKIVHGRSSPRKWRDEQKAESFLKAVLPEGTEAHVHTLLSPARAEGILKKSKRGALKEIDALVFTSKGQLKLAPISDKRPAVTPGHEYIDDFEDSDDDMFEA